METCIIRMDRKHMQTNAPQVGEGNLFMEGTHFGKI